MNKTGGAAKGKTLTRLERAVLKAVMARWEEYLASYKGNVRSAIKSAYPGKSRALSKACAMLSEKARRGAE